MQILMPIPGHPNGDLDARVVGNEVINVHIVWNGG